MGIVSYSGRDLHPSRFGSYGMSLSYSQWGSESPPRHAVDEDDQGTEDTDGEQEDENEGDHRGRGERHMVRRRRRNHFAKHRDRRISRASARHSCPKVDNRVVASTEAPRATCNRLERG